MGFGHPFIKSTFWKHLLSMCSYYSHCSKMCLKIFEPAAAKFDSKSAKRTASPDSPIILTKLKLTFHILHFIGFCLKILQFKKKRERCLIKSKGEFYTKFQHLICFDKKITNIKMYDIVNGWGKWGMQVLCGIMGGHLGHKNVSHKYAE